MTSLRFQLKDGASVLLRPIEPGDRDRLQKGMLQLSAKSRYQRFFALVRQFSEEQLSYFTEVDQQNHVAWAAADPSAPSLPGIGVARFVRLDKEPTIAEMAVAVADDFQQKGLATLLLAVLYLMAQTRGVRTLRSVVQQENHVIIDWLKRLGATETSQSSGVTELDLAVLGDDSLPVDDPSARHFQEALKNLRTALPQV